MIGPALGGGVAAWARDGDPATREATWVYVLNVAFSAAVAVLMVPVRLRPFARAFRPVSFESLLAGIRFVFRTELILATITLDLFAVLLGGATALLPIYAKDILHAGTTGLG